MGNHFHAINWRTFDFGLSGIHSYHFIIHGMALNHPM
jgi:hypothetical protein